METISFDLNIGCGVAAVMDAFWEAERWPQVAPHIKRIDMHFRDPNVQVLSMTVQTGAREDIFKTVRVRQPHAIFYYQPTPPPLLRRHYGWWEMRSDGENTLLTSKHELDIDCRKAERFLAQAQIPASGEDAIVEAVKQMVRRNSLQTMLGMKRRLEEEQ